MTERLTIPTRLEALEHRVAVALRIATSYPARVDLTHIPDHIREQVREELEELDYGVWWNGSSADAPKAKRILEAVGMPGLVQDYWLIFPCPVEET